MGSRPGKIAIVAVTFLAVFIHFLLNEHLFTPRLAKASRMVRSIGKLIASEVFGVDKLSMPYSCLNEVLTKAEKNNPDSVLKAIDDYGWAGNFMINIGDVKGAILDSAVKKSNPKVAVEMGTFIGYGSVRLSRNLPPGGMLYTCDPNPVSYAVSNALINFAGLQDRVTVFYGYSQDLLKKLVLENKKIDLLFLDHLKYLYKYDMVLAENLGLLADNCTIVGDNVLFPSALLGVTDFKSYILEHKKYQTVVHDTCAEYTDCLPDQVTISVRDGSPGKSIVSETEMEEVMAGHWRSLDERPFYKKIPAAHSRQAMQRVNTLDSTNARQRAEREESDDDVPKSRCLPFSFFRKKVNQYQPFQNLTRSQPSFPSHRDSRIVQQQEAQASASSASARNGYPNATRVDQGARLGSRKSNKPAGWGRAQYEAAVAQAEQDQIEQAIRASLSESPTRPTGKGYPKGGGITADWKNLSEAERIQRRESMAQAAEARLKEDKYRGVGNKKKADAMRNNTIKQELIGQVQECYRRIGEDPPLQLGLMSLPQLRRHYEQMKVSQVSKAEAAQSTTFANVEAASSSSAAVPKDSGEKNAEDTPNDNTKEPQQASASASASSKNSKEKGAAEEAPHEHVHDRHRRVSEYTEIDLDEESPS
eukprot:gene967-1144_t